MGVVSIVGVSVKSVEFLVHTCTHAVTDTSTACFAGVVTDVGTGDVVEKIALMLEQDFPVDTKMLVDVVYYQGMFRGNFIIRNEKCDIFACKQSAEEFKNSSWRGPLARECEGLRFDVLLSPTQSQTVMSLDIFPIQFRAAPLANLHDRINSSASSSVFLLAVVDSASSDIMTGYDDVFGSSGRATDLLLVFLSKAGASTRWTVYFVL